jgi:hypothetical protein
MILLNFSQVPKKYMAFEGVSLRIIKTQKKEEDVELEFSAFILI